MSDPFLFLLLSLTCYRLWRLIGRDVILERPRIWVLLKLPGKMDFGVTCPWCSSLWWSAPIVFAVDRWFRPLPLPVLWYGGVVTVCGLLGHTLDD